MIKISMMHFKHLNFRWKLRKVKNMWRFGRSNVARIMLYIQIAIIATRLDCSYRIRTREMKLVNFKTIAACACFLIASGMRKAAYLEGRGMHVTKAYLKTHSRDAVFLWEAATRWQVRKLGIAFVAIHVAQWQCRFKRVSFDSPAENLFVSNYISSINNQDSLANKLKIIYI